MSPEKSLWLSVLYLALSDYIGIGRRAGEIESLDRWRQDAAAWFHDDQDHGVGSLDYVASILGFDAAAVRETLDRTPLEELEARWRGRNKKLTGTIDPVDLAEMLPGVWVSGPRAGGKG